MGAVALLAWSVHAGLRDGAGAWSFVPGATGSALLAALALLWRRTRGPAPSGIDSRLALLAGKNPAMLWIDSLDGREFVNAEYARFVGVESGELLGTAWKRHVHPDDLVGYEEAYRDAIERRARFERQLRLRVGTEYRWIQSVGSPLVGPRGELEGYAGYSLDITSTKRAEERLRLLWDAAAVLLSTNDADSMLRGLYLTFSPHLALDAYFNFMLSESGDSLALQSCLGISEDAARSIARLELGQAVCGTVALLKKPMVATCIQDSVDPKTRIVKQFGLRAYACFPLLSGDKLLGTLSFASRSRDRFDPEDLEFLRTICDYVTVSYVRLRLVRELRESDRRKDEFLATLAHELRNPLAPMRNAVQFLRLKGLPDPELQSARDILDRQLSHMKRLVDDLLDVSRITRGKILLRKERVSLGMIVANAVESIGAFIEGQGHRLKVTAPEEPLFLEGDPARLSQVLVNLLDNAAKYTPQGGSVSLHAERQGSDVVVSVRDTGIGIPRDMLPRVFDLFTQVDRSLEKTTGGLGIGLTLVERLVAMHGGSVEARSEGIAKGSEFIVRLPLQLVPPRAETAASPPLDETAIGGGSSRRRILVVDDNQDAADSLSAVLRLRGHEVRTAYDGQAAVEAAGYHTPEVAFLDIGLPRLNGYEVARRIREHDWGKRMYLVALTGWGQPDDRAKAREAGFDRHLTKPVDPGLLEQVLLEASVPPPPR